MTLKFKSIGIFEYKTIHDQLGMLQIQSWVIKSSEIKTIQLTEKTDQFIIAILAILSWNEFYLSCHVVVLQLKVKMLRNPWAAILTCKEWHQNDMFFIFITFRAESDVVHTTAYSAYIENQTRCLIDQCLYHIDCQ